MPFRDKEGTEPTAEQKAFCRWIDHKAEYKSRTWEDYRADAFNAVAQGL